LAVAAAMEKNVAVATVELQVRIRKCEYGMLTSKDSLLTVGKVAKYHISYV
jgi:hypothetical protein